MWSNRSSPKRIRAKCYSIFQIQSNRNSVIVSNSTISADYILQIPDPNDPNKVKMSIVNNLFDVEMVTDIP